MVESARNIFSGSRSSTGKTQKEGTGQAGSVANSLYSRGLTKAGREPNHLVSIGRKIVEQTTEVLASTSPTHRIYSFHEPGVGIIKKGESHPDCEFGAIVALSKNDDGLILSHMEYQ